MFSFNYFSAKKNFLIFPKETWAKIVRDIVSSKQLLSLLLITLLASLLAACKGGGSLPAPESEALPVVVEQLQLSEVQDKLELDGAVAPSEQVNLVARVAGYLEKVHFKDGDRVQAGQTLFSIEQAPYMQQVQLNRAKVELARTDYERQIELLKEKATALSSVETSLSNLTQAQANLRLAEINLSYTTIRAPFNGVVGRSLVDPGNYVGATPGGTTLATLMQVSPVYVYASVGEREALRVRQRMIAQGRTAKSAVGIIQVQAQMQSESQGSELGTLDFVDKQANQVAGTVNLRGRFINSDQHLIPGFYAKLIVDMGVPRQTLVLPARAVLSDQQGEYVFTVDAGGVAHRRAVKTSALPQEKKELLSGLNEGEQLVVDGYARLSEGTKVSVQPSTAPATAIQVSKPTSDEAIKGAGKEAGA